MSDTGTGNKASASEILRRRGERTSKLQRAIDRGSPRSQTEDSADNTAAPEEQRRPVKPVRITVDLSSSQHRFLREYCLNTGTKGTSVLRGLLTELSEDPELRSKLTQRLKQ